MGSVDWWQPLSYFRERLSAPYGGWDDGVEVQCRRPSERKSLALEASIDAPFNATFPLLGRRLVVEPSESYPISHWSFRLKP